jgi:hypothetical protein
MAAEPRFVDVTYRGLKVATKAKVVESAPGVAFVELDAPLPVGTTVRLGGDKALDVRVTAIVEQEAGARSPPGMHIAWGAALPSAAAEPGPAPETVAAPEAGASITVAPGAVALQTAAPRPEVVAPDAADTLDGIDPAEVLAADGGDAADAAAEPGDADAPAGAPADDGVAGGGEGGRRRRRRRGQGRPPA